MYKIESKSYLPADVIKNGNQFLIANGYMGYRGTLEEYTKDEMVGLNLAGIYNQPPRQLDPWRESVNVYNPLYTFIKISGRLLHPTYIPPLSHVQILDMYKGLHYRRTVYNIDSAEVSVQSERFVSQIDKDIICMKYQFMATDDIEMELYTGIDTSIFDLNGPHLERYHFMESSGIFTADANTTENRIPVCVSEGITFDIGTETKALLYNNQPMHWVHFRAIPNKIYTLYKYASVQHTKANSVAESIASVKRAMTKTYKVLLEENCAFWEQHWKLADIELKGDDAAQLGIRNCIYHLISSRPYADHQSISTRGLSGQGCKGSICWDTDIFMLPFFLNTDPESARKIVMYRALTLEGAKRKASKYGYTGAFFAWESQDSGDEACSDYNITDALTKAPIRTYFNQKQIHISADVVFAFDQYIETTGDLTVLEDGGLETVIECARFYQSFVTWKPDQKIFVCNDVIGPDEYHEGVNNNAFTNHMIMNTFKVMFKFIKMMREYNSEFVRGLIARKGYTEEITKMHVIERELLQQLPDKRGIIEQFDGYHDLEEVSLDNMVSRIDNPSEYLGGKYGKATPTKIIKKADVIAMMALFPDEFSKRVKLANWDYYEPKAERGSSLSDAFHAIVGSEIGKSDEAYDYFMHSVTVDITGKEKNYNGSIYVGGTHPGASGGSYMALIYGFAGLKREGLYLKAETRLPKNISELRFKCLHRGKIAQVLVRANGAKVTWEKKT
jgi:trehalose/maltose hydrolase-like predicted phosphorylase